MNLFLRFSWQKWTFVLIIIGAVALSLYPFCAMQLELEALLLSLYRSQT